MGCTLQQAIVIHIVLWLLSQMLLQISYPCIFTKPIIPDKHLTITAGSLPLAHNAGHSTSYKCACTRYILLLFKNPSLEVYVSSLRTC